MALTEVNWLTAFNRFGLGARGSDSPAAGDPLELLKAELRAPGAGRLDSTELPSTASALIAMHEYDAERNQAHARADALAHIAEAMPAPSVTPFLIAPPDSEPKRNAADRKNGPPNPIQQIFQQEAAARLAAACAPRIGFVERLVAFWSNHFCVSAAKDQSVRVSAGAFEREAIRPHVLGRFSEMLRAVEQHPAMLHFLDNAQSVGPNSPAGLHEQRGLNENLAREILELHTLGVEGGYTQADVTEFARVLTGWTVVGPGAPVERRGLFAFNTSAHEPGDRTVLGVRYPEEDVAVVGIRFPKDGVKQGEAVLEHLARAPATAQHIARKFARAFVADRPPDGLVERLTTIFVKTDGDLAALAEALITDPEAWSARPEKLRDPWEMLVAAYRALALDPKPPQRIQYQLSLLGMPLWTPGGPNGFPNAASAWLSPEGVKTRLELASALGAQAKEAPEPRDLIERVLPQASEMTRQAVLRAESRPQAYALLLMSPEFQRK